MKHLVRVVTFLVSAVLLLSMLSFPIQHFVMPVSAEETETIDLPMEVTYHQTEARKQLDMINAFRTSGDAWYWNSDNTQKISVGKLPALTYDYALEKVAMQRAAEIAVSYSHTRPDGSEPWTAYGEQGYSSSYKFENIAYGFLSSQEVFVAWREDNGNYGGQGHRRNMLGYYKENYYAKAFGAACVECDGRLYWVEEFSDRVNSSSAAAALDGTVTKTVSVNKSDISGWKMTPSSADILHEESGNLSETAALSVVVNGRTFNVPEMGKDLSWASSDTNIVSVSGDTYTAEDIGTAVLSASTPTGGQVSFTVNVKPGYELDHWAWAQDHSSAVIYLKHKNSGKVISGNALLSNNIVPAKCTETGKKTIYADFTYEGIAYRDSAEELIPPTGHNYGPRTYTWSSDNKTVTAKAVCQNDSSHIAEEKVSTIYKVVTPAECEKDGSGTYTAAFRNSLFSTQIKHVTIKATGHSYGTPTYTWSSDKKTVTAKAVCANDKSHVVEETVSTTNKITTQPTCEKDGVRTYTAVFTNSLFKTQTKTEAVAKTGHKYGTPAYTWSSDNKTVTAKAVCQNDKNHVLEEKASTTYKVVTPAACEKDGSGTYTASFKNTLFKAQTKNVTIKATGHKYGTPSYTWSSDNKTVTAKAVCANDKNHVVEEKVNTTYKVTTAASCEKDGTGTYTATFKNSLFKTQTKNVPIPATGHKYGTPSYTWSSDNKTVTAKAVCQNDSSHVLEEKAGTTYKVVTPAACEKDGSGTYTAVFKNSLFKTQTKNVTIKATGHKYGTPSYTWSSDNKTVTAKAVCANDKNHVVEEKVSTTYKVTTAASCEKDGTGTYTAAFKNSLFKTQTKNVTIKATGHKYGTPSYTWSSDNQTVTAKAVCTNDKNHVVEEKVSTTYKVTKEATEKAEGEGQYTAVFKNSLFKTQTKTVKIPKVTKGVDMYRIYNPNSGEHFYTKDSKEKDALVNVHGWKFEGVGWVAPVKSNTPVYRLYNKTGGEHHYTTDKKERDALINKHGWKDEGIGWYSDDNQKVKVFREYNPNAFANNHNYTPDTKEHNALINKYGWKDEGIAWYAISGRK